MPRSSVSSGRRWCARSSRLDLAATEPDVLDDDGAEQSLRRLQYSLHVSSEHVVGLVPPPGEETAHAELEAALLAARDATAEVAEAVSAWGAAGVEPLLHEWRGALFRVRLARLRLTPPGQVAPIAAAEDYDGPARPLARLPARAVRRRRLRRRRRDRHVAGLGGRDAGRRRVGRRLPAVGGGESRERLLLAEQLHALEQPG